MSTTVGIGIALACLVLGTGSADGHEINRKEGRVEKLHRMIEALENECGNISIHLVAGPEKLRAAIAGIDEFKNLAANIDDDLVAAVHEEFTGEPAPRNPDVVFSALCCLLEVGARPQSVPVLIDFYGKAQGRMLFSPNFAVHALKVITEQKDLDADYYTYSSEEGVATVSAAQAWLAARQKHEEKDNQKDR